MVTGGTSWEVVIDAGESPIESSKKTTPLLFWLKEAAYIKNANCSR
jgi:hypothetical protein